MLEESQKLKTAYLGLSLELYLRTSDKLAEWRKAFENWNEKLGAFTDIRYSKLCFTDADISEAEEAILRSGCEAIVLSAVSYTPSMLIVPLLQKLRLPVLIWSTQDSEIIRENYAPEDLTLNHTVQGIQDITNVLFQRGIPFTIVSGHWEDKNVLGRLQEAAAAIRAANAARRIRVLTLGGAFQGMGDFDFDPVLLREKWGPETVSLGIEEFLSAVRDVGEAEVTAELRQDRERFEISPSLQEETHRESIRRKLALEKMLKKYQANAFTMNFTRLVDGSFGQLPFYAINCLMAEGIGYAGEGDVLRAAAMRQLVELTGQANFSEIYTVDFRRDLFFMSHMQECSTGVARRDRKILLKQMRFWVPGNPDYTGMFFTAEPGDYTLVCITPERGGGFRMLAFSGQVPDLPVLETYNRAYWLFRPDQPVEKVLDWYSIMGGAHHLSAVPGRQIPALALLAKQLGFTFVSPTE